MKISLSRIKLSVLPGLSEVGSLAIAFVFFIIAAFALLALVSLSLMMTDSRMSVNFVQRLQAQYVAEAGIEYGIELVIDGQALPYSETVALYGGSFDLSLVDQDTVIVLTSTGGMEAASKGVQAMMKYKPSIADFALYSAGDIKGLTALDEEGDPDSTLIMDNTPLPDMDTPALIAMATAQGHVYIGDIEPFHGYPNFNFYFSAGTPNVTYVTGDLAVLTGRTIYGIYVVDGSIRLDGFSRVEGVLFMTNSNNVVIDVGNGANSSVSGGILAAGDIDGKNGENITVQYNAEYMGRFAEHENAELLQEIFSWREL